jgi:hypothetical protein
MSDSKDVTGTFTCELCKLTYDKGRSDEDAEVEFYRTFPEEQWEEETAVLCDDCFNTVMDWAKKKGIHKMPPGAGGG